MSFLCKAIRFSKTHLSLNKYSQPKCFVTLKILLATALSTQLDIPDKIFINVNKREGEAVDEPSKQTNNENISELKPLSSTVSSTGV